MSWVSRIANLFRREEINRELEEELASHIEEAVERGRSAVEAQRAFGNALLVRERSRDLKLLPWLEAVVSDIVFGWRQIHKHRAASAAAILSLALAIGATTAAFRLVDAVLLRKLPVAEPERLFFLATSFIDREGHPDFQSEFDYPTFRKYRTLVADRADLLLAGMAARQDAQFGPGGEMERVSRQYVSGNLFGLFGLRPALGRLLTPNDDATPGGHPLAVLGYDFWTRRFGRNPAILGTTFRMGNDRFEIVGVAPKGYFGTEPGDVIDLFIPATMNVQALNSPGWSWFRIFVRPRIGFSPEQVRQPIEAFFANDHQERLTAFHSDTPKQAIDAFLSEKILLFSAASGSSNIQKEYRRPLWILGLLVALVLLVACANVGNLMTAQAAARSREMALRVSIGAGQWRLIQLVLVESAMLAAAASTLGLLFAWWSAPIVVSMLRVPEDPVRLILVTGWRELAFSVSLAFVVTLLFGLAPALRASGVKPAIALRGGENPYGHRRLMNTMLAAQMAFCVMVQFVAGLFVATFERLSSRPLGFSHEHLLVMDTSARTTQPVDTWMQMAEHLRQVPGVESVSVACWNLLSGNRWTASVRVPGHPIMPRSPYFLEVAPGFFETMRIGWIDGRDIRPRDSAPRVNEGRPAAGAGIVNEEFARVYFDGQNPVGRVVEVRPVKDIAVQMEIIGYVRDAAYGSVRETIRPTVYVPQGERNSNALLVRTAGDPLALAPVLRREISQGRSDFRVRSIQPQSNFVRWHMLRERLLATLSLFFALVALVLAAIGLYGVLNYSVTQQRREIGIRMALGARSGHVVRRITVPMAAMVCAGSAVGLAGGVAGGRFIEALLFEVKPTDAGMMALPLLMLFGAALLSCLPAAIRAVRIDPAQTLRGE